MTSSVGRVLAEMQHGEGRRRVFGPRTRRPLAEEKVIPSREGKREGINCRSIVWSPWAFMRHSFKVMHDELHTGRHRISPAWVHWVGEKAWHESQRG